VSDSFFDYACDACDAPVCERMLLFGLANDIEEDTLCLDCLAKQLDVPKGKMMTKTRRYIMSRDCFKKPWLAFEASGCPLVENCCSAEGT
jgi:hypothetical protein